MILTGFGAVPIAVGLAIAAIAGIGIAIYKYWDEIKAFFSQSWGDIGTQLKDKIVGAFTGALAAAKDLWTEFWTWATEGSMQDRAFEANKEGGAFAKMKAGYGKLKEAEEARQPAIPDDPRIQGLRGLSDEHKQALAGLDDITAKTKEVEKIERAIAALRALPSTSSDHRSEQEIRRLEAQLELQKRQLDPVKERLRTMDIEIADAQAITAEQKNQLEVLAEIRGLEEQVGKLTDDQRKAIEQKTKALQDAKKATAFTELKQSLQDQLQSAQAITQAEQNRVAILQQINSFERENGKLVAGQREELEKLLCRRPAGGSLQGAAVDASIRRRRRSRSTRTTWPRCGPSWTLAGSRKRNSTRWGSSSTARRCRPAIRLAPS